MLVGDVVSHIKCRMYRWASSSSLALPLQDETQTSHFGLFLELLAPFIKALSAKANPSVEVCKVILQAGSLSSALKKVNRANV